MAQGSLLFAFGEFVDLAGGGVLVLEGELLVAEGAAQFDVGGLGVVVGVTG